MNSLPGFSVDRIRHAVPQTQIIPQVAAADEWRRHAWRLEIHSHLVVNVVAMKPLGLS